MPNIAINGFGRIGRRLTRLLLEQSELTLVAINDLHPIATMAHLFRYDSIHGRWKERVNTDGQTLWFGDLAVQYSASKTLEGLPWRDLNIDLVVDATGVHKTSKALQGYGAITSVPVLLTVPSSDNSVPMVIAGVREDAIDQRCVSNASCTTNSAAPLIQLLDELCGIESCYITTVHSYTLDQNLHDAPHRDWRRGRAAAQSIVPTTTGAAKALTHIFPHLKVQIGGFGIRVPVPDGSLTDITCNVRNPKPVAAINHAFELASQTRYRGILQYAEEPLVSADIIGNRHSCIFDAALTSVIGNMVKVIGWYDNETGYSARLIDVIRRMV